MPLGRRAGQEGAANPILRPSGLEALIGFDHKNAVQMASGLLIEGLLILVLIIANGIFSGSEIAVVSAR